jgi:hypothetical protein
MATRAKNRKKSFPVFTGQITGVIYRSVKYHPLLCTSLAYSALLQQMPARAKNIKILSGLHRSNHWWDFNQLLKE